MSDIPTVHLHIGHETRTTGSGGTRTHIHPVTGEALAQVPLAGPAEVAEAVARAEAAREGWRRTSPEARGAILYKLADSPDEFPLNLSTARLLVGKGAAGGTGAVRPD